MSIATISPTDLAKRRQTGESCDLIDVRTPAEFREVHLDFARNVPLDQLDPDAVVRARNGNSGEPLYVVCQLGGRSQKACEAFVKKGYANVVNVEGGTAACVAAGLPVERGQKAISIERQVRIVAGSLTLIGVILGWQVHPAFYGLSGFIGAGLLFAGISNTCGMGMLLMKMPWNR
jgi:rhodanese-related sulfurtransferase